MALDWWCQNCVGTETWKPSIQVYCGHFIVIECYQISGIADSSSLEINLPLSLGRFRFFFNSIKQLCLFTVNQLNYSGTGQPPRKNSNIMPAKQPRCQHHAPKRTKMTEWCQHHCSILVRIPESFWGEASSAFEYIWSWLFVWYFVYVYFCLQNNLGHFLSMAFLEPWDIKWYLIMVIHQSSSQ